MSVEERRAAARRLILAVTIGLSIEILRGALLPPLAAVIAIQILTGSKTAPPLGGAIAMVATAILASVLTFVVTALADGGGLLEFLWLSLLYLLAFVVCFTPSVAVLGAMALTMLIVISSITNISEGFGLLVVAELGASFVQGFALVYVAHLVFPTRHQVMPEPDKAQPVAGGPSMSVGARAALATAVIVPAHVYLNADGVASLVILLTIAAMIRQPSLTESGLYAFGHVVGNAVGASLAAVSAFVVLLHPHDLLLICIILANAAFFSERIVRTDALSPSFVPGLVAFSMLFGMVFSIAPLGTDVPVIDRLVQIIAAAAYVVAAVSVLVAIVPRQTDIASVRSENAGQ